MIDLQEIKKFFPPIVQQNPDQQVFMLKEYILSQILEYISHSSFSNQLVFIGGTNLRLIKKIDRFSENVTFEGKGISATEYEEFVKGVVRYLQNYGYSVVLEEQKSDYREKKEVVLLLNDERIMISVHDQEMEYLPQPVHVTTCGLRFPILSPSDDILCAMKLSALLSRAKGRDFYDAMYLLSFTKPNYDFLLKRCGIGDEKQLIEALLAKSAETNLEQKQSEFKRLLFNEMKSDQILEFPSFVENLEKIQYFS